MRDNIRIDGLTHITASGVWLDGVRDASVSALLRQMDEAKIDVALVTALQGSIDNTYGAQRLPIVYRSPTACIRAEGQGKMRSRKGFAPGEGAGICCNQVASAIRKVYARCDARREGGPLRRQAFDAGNRLRNRGRAGCKSGNSYALSCRRLG
jgi:hypothetical protein